jgi:hypothetical protein
VLKACIVAFAEAAAGRDDGKLASNCVQTYTCRKHFYIGYHPLSIRDIPNDIIAVRLHDTVLCDEPFLRYRW